MQRRFNPKAVIYKDECYFFGGSNCMKTSKNNSIRSQSIHIFSYLETVAKLKDDRKGLVLTDTVVVISDLIIVQHYE